MYYRTLIPVLLYAITAAGAPQNGGESEITYVKIQPVTDRSTLAKSIYRESRIENIPLTVPAKITDEEIAEVVPEISGKIEDETVKSETETKDGETGDSDVITDNKRRARSEDATSSYESETVEPTEAVTESVEELLQQTEEYESRTKSPSPRFLSKLSYFQKGDDVIRSSLATNLVERTGKRRFKSKCRCEKIWNCPKLQITVPRCPNEYFLCCF